MSKQFPYPFPERFRSRLMLHYRTRISGTEAQKKLPFRVLVLGNFMGQEAHGEDAQGRPDSKATVTVHPLADRHVRSFRFGRAGARVDDFMAELLPYVTLDPTLETTLQGKLEDLTLSGKIPSKTADGETTKVKLSGIAQFVSTEADNGLCDVRGHVHVRADLDVDLGKLPQDVEVELVCRGTARGYLTVAAKDEPVGIVAGVVQSTKAKLTFQRSEDDDGLLVAVPPKDPLTTGAKRVLHFDSIESFSPDEVVGNVPELHRLRVIRELLNGLRSELRNAPDLSAEIKRILKEQGKDLAALGKELEQPYAELAITPAKAAPNGSGNGNPPAGGNSGNPPADGNNPTPDNQ